MKSAERKNKPFLKFSHVVLIQAGVFVIPILLTFFLSKTFLSNELYHLEFLHSLILVSIFLISSHASWRSYRAYVSRKDIRFTFLSVAFAVFATSFLLHGLIDFFPNFFFAEFFDVTEHYSLFVGSIFIYGLLFRERVKEKIEKYHGKILFLSIFLISLGFLFSLFNHQFLSSLHSAVDIVSVVTALILFSQIVLLLFRYRKTPNRSLFFLILGLSVLATNGIIPLYYAEWNINWWIFHFVSLASFVLLSASVHVDQGVEFLFKSVFKGILLRKRFSFKITVIILIIAVVPWVTVGLYMLDRYENSIEEQILADLTVIAEAKEGNILSYMDNLREEVSAMSLDPTVLEELIFPDAEKGEEVEIHHHLVGYVAANNEVHGIDFLDTDGVIAASSNPVDIGKSRKDESYFKEALKLKLGEVYTSGIRLKSHHMAHNIGTIDFSAPVFEEESGGMFGVIVVRVDTTELADILSGKQQVDLGAISGDRGRRETFDIYLVGGDKKMVTPSRFTEGTDYINIPVDVEAVSNCTSLVETTGVWWSFRGEEVYGATMCLPIHNWVLLTEVSKDEIFGQFLVLRELLLSVFFAVSGLMALVVIFYIKRSLLPLKKLAKTAENISEGSMDSRVKIETNDEFGKVAEIFDEMLDAIDKNQKDLKKMYLNTEKEKIKMEAILASIGDGVIACDPRGRVILMNKVAEDITGYNLEEAVGKLYKDVLNFTFENKNNKQPQDFIGKAMKSKKPVNAPKNILLIRKDKTTVPIGDSAAPVRNSKGKLLGVVVVFRDISYQKEVDKVKNEFLSVAAHQLRTPIGSLAWGMEVLLSDDLGKIPKKAKDLLIDMLGNNRRLSKLVDELLNVTRIEQLRVPDNPENVDIAESLREAVVEITPLAKENNSTVIYNKSKLQIKNIFIDALRLHQVFLNILSNAVKYNVDGGKVTVTVEPKEKGVEVVFKDTGIGIPKEDLKKVSTRFYRASNAVKKQTKGSGLGVYVVKSYIEAWGGKISIDSVEFDGKTDNHGTTIVIFLPYNPKSGILSDNLKYKPLTS